MKKKVIVLWMLLVNVSLFAQTGFNKQEFQSRRDKLFAKIPGGIAIIFAAQEDASLSIFRQSPDFYYLTGIEEPNAILVMVESSKKSFIFCEKKEDFEIMVNGPGIWQDSNPKATYDINLFPIENFWTYLSYWVEKAQKLYLPLTAMDNRDQARGEVMSAELKQLSHPLFGRISGSKEAVKRIRDMFPGKPIENVNSIIDEMRWVKTAYEIERLRMSGKIGAEGVKEAIKGTKPGLYEYELEATARYYYTKRGARDGFPPIVASGPNTITIHYMKNNRRMQAGEVVLMDYGTDYNYYESDITRTWPVSGKFDGDQEKMYRCIFDARNAIISAMKPGITVNQMKAIGDSVYKKYGFEKEYLAWGKYVGHYVGICVHDVMPYGSDKPMEAGVVFNVEPVIENRDKKIHMRLEDTVLITENGAEVLTKDVPAGIDEIYALIKQKGLGSN